jgi:hypothetical protein
VFLGFDLPSPTPSLPTTMTSELRIREWDYSFYWNMVLFVSRGSESEVRSIGLDPGGGQNGAIGNCTLE